MENELIIRDINNRVNLIKLLDFGFINGRNQNIINMIIPILIHCVENSQLFTEKQSNNLINIINSLNIN